MSEPPETILNIRVTPRAKKNEIAQVLPDGTIKIRLTAPPVEGKANQALIKFLAKILEISSAKIELVSGKRSRDKVVSVAGINSETSRNRIVESMG